MKSKAIIFDTGPIISLGINNILWILKELKQRFGGEFYIAPAVKKELVDKPLKSKRFKFEAMQVKSLLETGVLKVIKNPKIKQKTKEIENLANNIFYIHNHPMKTFHKGELETLAAAITTGIKIIVVDERITRTLIEKPQNLENRLEKKMHADVKVNTKKLKKFNSIVKHLQIIRSIELATIAFEKGLMEKYLVKIPNAKKELLESILWAIKLNGCSVMKDEIETIIKEVGG